MTYLNLVGDKVLCFLDRLIRKEYNGDVYKAINKIFE